LREKKNTSGGGVEKGKKKKMFARLDSAAAAAGWALSLSLSLSIVLSHCSERERVYTFVVFYI